MSKNLWVSFFNGMICGLLVAILFFYVSKAF